MKPSELIKLALGDLKKCEEDKNYRIDMSWWLMPLDDICYVCLAGSVMAQTLNVPLSGGCEAVPQDTEWNNELHALNYFRQGLIDLAFDQLHLTKPDIENIVDITPYREDSDLFKRDMNRLAERLVEHGC